VTPALRLGAAPEWALTAIGAGALLLALLRRRTGARRATQ
jgi:hypothetical protein